MKNKCLLSLVLQAACVVGAQGFDLAGTWHVSGLGLPGGIVQNRNAEGVVIGLNGNDSFDANEGTLTISPAGVVSGAVGDTVAGTAAVSPEGVVSLNLTSPDVMTLTFQITPTSDLMATSHGQTDYHELLVLAKAPGDALPADVTGSWWVVQLETPASIDLQYNQDGKATGLNNSNSFRQSRHLLVIDSGGHYNYNSGEELGTVNVAADGTMSITPDDPQEPGLQFYMNALKDVMITASARPDNRSLIVLVKHHEVRNWEAAGHWAMSSANLPPSLSVSLNGDNFVTNIEGLNAFGHTNGTIDFTVQGGLSGVLGDAFAGNSAGSADGLISIYHGEPTPFVGAMNAGGDFFAGVEDGTPGNDLMMMIAIRSVRPLAVGMMPGVPMKVVWVPGAGRVLQQAPNIVDWQNVPGSETTSSYTPSPGTDGARHFYRLGEP
jgi:hypothetical protein